MQREVGRPSCNQAAPPPAPSRLLHSCFSRFGVRPCAISADPSSVLLHVCSGGADLMGKTSHADWLSGIRPAFITLLVQAALAFQKYRLNDGLMLAATLAAVEWYEDNARSKGLPLSRSIVLSIAAGAGTLSLVLQRAALVLATALAHAITLS